MIRRASGTIFRACKPMSSKPRPASAASPGATPASPASCCRAASAEAAGRLLRRRLPERPPARRPPRSRPSSTPPAATSPASRSTSPVSASRSTPTPSRRASTRRCAGSAGARPRPTARVARALGAGPEAARDVGQAMAHNPVPLIVPCHRVLAAGGALGGFSAPGGAATKRRMLALEGVEPEAGAGGLRLLTSAAVGQRAAERLGRALRATAGPGPFRRRSARPRCRGRRAGRRAWSRRARRRRRRRRSASKPAVGLERTLAEGEVEPHLVGLRPLAEGHRQERLPGEAEGRERREVADPRRRARPGSTPGTCRSVQPGRQRRRRRRAEPRLRPARRSAARRGALLAKRQVRVQPASCALAAGGGVVAGDERRQRPSRRRAMLKPSSGRGRSGRSRRRARDSQALTGQPLGPQKAPQASPHCRLARSVTKSARPSPFRSFTVR